MNEDWVRAQWEVCDFGDFRLEKRALNFAQACMDKPEQSIPKKFNDWSGCKAAYRLLSSNMLSHQKIQKTHRENVISEAKQTNDTVLFIQDGSELLYNNHKWTHGLGPTADSCGNGMMFHSALALRMCPEQRSQILGLAHQKVWVRPKTKTLESTEKESKVWLETLEQIGRVPQGCNWISVGDRASDIYETMEGAQKLGWKHVTRSKHNRNIVVDGKKNRLQTWVKKLPVKAQIQIYLRARKGFCGKNIHLKISWDTFILPPPSKCKGENLSLTALRVWSEEGKKLEWTLLSDLSVESREDALRIIDIYRRRWLIEEYHKALKTGCKIEQAQLRYAKRLMNLLGFLGVIATQLLALKELVYFDRDSPAIDHVPEEIYKIVRKYWKLRKPTVYQFWRHVARLGGFLARKSDGEPGWQSLWAGLSRVNDMLLGSSLL